MKTDKATEVSGRSPRLPLAAAWQLPPDVDSVAETLRNRRRTKENQATHKIKSYAPAH